MLKHATLSTTEYDSYALVAASQLLRVVQHKRVCTDSRQIHDAGLGRRGWDGSGVFLREAWHCNGHVGKVTRHVSTGIAGENVELVHVVS